MKKCGRAIMSIKREKLLRPGKKRRKRRAGGCAYIQFKRFEEGVVGGMRRSPFLLKLGKKRGVRKKKEKRERRSLVFRRGPPRTK